MMNEREILIVDDDESIRKVLGFILEEAGYTVRSAGTAEEALALAAERTPHLIISDIKMPRVDGITFLKEVRKRLPAVPVVMLTAFGTIETAVEAMKLGAVDYLTKPISRDELKLSVEKIFHLRSLEEENRSLKESLREKFQFENIIGMSPAMRRVFDMIARVATTDASVLITGESGTGKELVARAIHFNGPRRSARLVTVNCAAIPSELLESELFGHVRGAFTGAIRDKDGKFQLADGGTIFLDEIGSLTSTLQAKLLRALQEKEIEKVGAEAPVVVDVRIIAATNQPLPDLIRGGSFREDLYYRLNVVPINLPPLRERTSDIGPLTRHFVDKYGAGRAITFTGGAIEALATYSWPGNVRELENFCERIILMNPVRRIDEAVVRAQLELMASEQGDLTPGRQVTLPELERRAVVDALTRAGGNQSRAARLLGIPRHVLLYRIKKFNIPPDVGRD
jgi:DNA-binding NtrC family response regulator